MMKQEYAEGKFAEGDLRCK